MYYKIVNQDLTSFNNYVSGILSVKYKKMKWVEPYDIRAPLCVLDSIENVNNFLLNHVQNIYNRNYYIFECAIEKSNRTWYRCPNPEVIHHRLEKNITESSFCSWPRGTVLADKVMLIKKITEPPKQIYYKIVSQDLKSISVESDRLGLPVQYYINNWTLPKIPEAPLMVFKTLEDAENFKTFHGKDKVFIYKCEIIKSNKKWKYIHVYELEKYNEILKLKRNKKKFSDIFTDDHSFPRGTVLADAVKILDERIL